MRVAFISYDFGEYSIQHAAALARHGEVLLALPRQLAEPHLDKLDPTVRFLPFDRPRLRQPWKQLVCLRRILRAVRDFRPDVIHLQSGHLWFNLALPLLRDYPLVLTIHDPRPHLGDHESRKTPEAVRALAYRRADRVIAHAQPVKKEIVEHLGIAADKIHVVPHVAIGDRGADEHGAEEEGLVLFFGRIWEYKGLDYLIRAEPLITARAPQARFLIAGEGENFARYERSMRHPERFEVHNRWISDGERTTMFRRASVVVLPYVEATQSGVVPIAYAHAKPVVATRTGGLPEVVDHGRTGFLVPPRDEAALAEAITCLLQNERLRREMGLAGREKLEAECSPQAVIEKTIPVYEAAIRDFHAQRSCGASRTIRDPEEMQSNISGARS